MKKNINKIMAKRKRKIAKRIKRKHWKNQLKLMFTTSNIHYEMGARHVRNCMRRYWRYTFGEYADRLATS